MTPGNLRKFSDLTSQDQAEVIRQYYADIKITSIITEFRLDVKPREFAHNFPERIYADASCKVCGSSPLYGKFLTRYPNRTARIEIYCRSCRHSPNASYCFCGLCDELRAKRSKEIQEDYDKTKEIWRKENQDRQESLRYRALHELNDLTEEKIGPRLEDLHLRHRLYLSALLRCAIGDSVYEILPLEDHKSRFAPTHDIAIEILLELAQEHIIRADTEKINPSYVVEFIAEQPRIYHGRIPWLINIQFPAGNDKEMCPSSISKVHFNNDELNQSIDIYLHLAEKHCQSELNSRIHYDAICQGFGNRSKLVFHDLLREIPLNTLFSVMESSIRIATDENIHGVYQHSGLINNSQNLPEIIRRLASQLKIGEVIAPEKLNIAADSNEIYRIIAYEILKVGSKLPKIVPNSIDFLGLPDGTELKQTRSDMLSSRYGESGQPPKWLPAYQEPCESEGNVPRTVNDPYP